MATTPSEQYWDSVIAAEPMTLLKITQRKLYDGAVSHARVTHLLT